MTWIDSATLLDLGRSAAEIGIIWAVLYWLLRAFERISAGGKMRGLILGLGLLVLAWVCARWLELYAISWLLQASLGFLAVVLIVVLQPELRRLFARLGGALPALDSGAAGDASTIRTLTDAVAALSARRIGGLIAIERRDHLDDLVLSNPFDCDLSVPAVLAIFWKDAPLHDGAVIVRRGRVAAAGVILPLSTRTLDDPELGTRHRTALGLSEDTDALVLIVSEETGAISVADRGELRRRLSLGDLEQALREAFRLPARVQTGRHVRNQG